MKKLLGNHYGNTYTPMDAGADFCGPLYAGRGGSDSTERWTPAGGGGRTLSGELTEEGGGGGRGPVTIFEAPRMDTEDARMEAVTECNSCSYYNRGECGRTGLESHPDDFCSRAVPAEA